MLKNYMNVLEQFYLELYQPSLWESCLFLCFILVVFYVSFYDKWLSFTFIVVALWLCYLDSNTNHFTLITSCLSLLIFFEFFGSFLEIGYFFLAIFTEFVVSKTQEHLGGRLQIYYIFLVGTAILLGCFNIMGLIPYTFALTGHFIFAFFFSLGYFIVNLIYGFLHHQGKFFNIFLPSGVPKFIIPALIIIEAISFFSRVLSLAIRLFANIVAGHILLKILASFVYVMGMVHSCLSLPFIISITGVCIIAALEVFISILQVYIFNLLLLIYINSVLNLH